MQVAPRANLANAFSVVVLAVYVIPHDHVAFAVAWISLALPAAALRVVAWWVGERDVTRQEQQANRRYYRVTIIEVAAQASLTTTLVVYLLPRVDTGRQIVLVATGAGIMGAGAIALSPLRSIGILWIAIHTVGMAVTFLAMGQTAYSVLAGQLVLYGAVLVVGVFHLANSFERRSLAEVAALRAQQVVELLLDDFEDGSRDWLWETGPDGTFTRSSERLAEVSGYSADELRRLTLEGLLGRLTRDSPEGCASLRELAAAMGRADGIRDHVLAVVVAGAERWWSLSAKPQLAQDGSVVGWRGVGVDITEEFSHEKELVRLAHTDPLTGLANRRSFQEKLQRCLSGQDGPGTSHLAIFDLDNFKSVNDTLGHGIGDELLQHVALRLLAQSRGDFVARLGGDEFAVIAQPESPPAFPQVLFARYQGAFADPFTVRGNRIEVSASVGCSHAMPLGASTDEVVRTAADEVVRTADLALYDAKGRGSGRMSTFTTSMSVRAVHRASLLAELGLAIDHAEFVFHYQPQHDVRTGRVVGHEALLRWQHPTRGLLLPSEFLELAETSGLIVPIGRLMLRRACQQLSAVGRGVRLAVNVSGVELAAAGFMDHVEATLAEYAVEPDRLELEVTESSAISDESIAFLRELRHLGVRVAIDDFGTGFSSLGSLQRMPVDMLKVDRTFSAALSQADSRAAEVALAIMRSAVEIADALGIKCLAEGIEDQRQLAGVRALGFDFVQGFYVATPAPNVSRHLTIVEPSPEPTWPVTPRGRRRPPSP